MKKKVLLLLTLTFCFILSLAAFAACGESGATGGNSTSGGASQGESGSGESGSQGGSSSGESGSQGESALLDFNGVTFANVTVDYDGNEYKAEVSGAPSDATVTYGGDYQPKTLPGTYTATAKVEKEGYNTLNLTATLKINPLNFTGVTFANVTVDYDGNPHSLAVSGAPSGTDITYSTTQNYIDAGVYTVKATLKKIGYNDKSLAATLTINKINFPESGLTFADVKVDYDETDHSGDVKLVGALPANTNVSYTITQNGTTVTSAVEAGDYTVTVKLTNKNYFDKSLAATLTIKTVKKDMAVYAMPDGTVYFSNGLDNDYLYSLSDSGKITKIKSDVVKSFVKSSETTLDYISTAAYINSIKTLTQGTATDSSDKTEDKVKALFSFGKFDYIALNGNTIYYSANFVTAAQSGIYSVDLTAEEPEAVKIFEGKTKNLAYYNGYLYFANGNDGNTLYKFSVTTKEAVKVADVKIHEFVFYGNTLYMTVNGTWNDYIGSIDLSKTNAAVKKLTDRAGEYLTVYDGYVYYNNSDLFTNFKPSERGVWKVSVNGANEAQVLKLENGINALTYDSKNNRFVYIDATDLHLYAYNVANGTITDLLKGFTPPEYKMYNTGGESVIRGNKLYYLNMFADKTLFSYDTVSGFKQQLTADKVTDFYIDGDYLYFNQVTNLTNNDLYRINLTLGGKAKKVSSNDCRDMVSYGDYLYYVHYNFAGAAGGLGRVKKDGSEAAIKFSEANGASNLRVVGDKLYYLDGGKIHYFDLTAITNESTKLEGTLLDKKVENVDQFEIEGDNLYYIYTGTFVKEIRRATLTKPSAYVALASKDTAPTEFVIAGDDIYYYSFPYSDYIAQDNDRVIGLYKVSKNATEKDGATKVKLLQTCTPSVKVDGVQNTDKDFYCAAMSVKDGKVYFLNSFYFGGTSFGGDDHSYCYDTANKTLTKLD